MPNQLDDFMTTSSAGNDTAAARWESLIRNTGRISEEDFATSFRKSISPAREALADFFSSFSAKMLGQEFTPLRARMLKEWDTVQKARVNEERMQGTIAIAQAADLRARELAAQRDATNRAALQTRERLGIMKNAVDLGRLDLAREIATVDEDLKNQKIDESQANTRLLEAKEKLTQEQAKTAGRAKDSYNAATQYVESLGLDPTENHELILAEAQKIEALKKAGKFAPVMSPGAGMRDARETNIYGESVTVTHNLRNNSFSRVNTTTGAADQVVNAGEASRKEFADTQDSGLFGRALFSQIQANPQVLRTRGQIANSLWPAAERLFQLRGPEERSIGNAMQQFLLQKIKAVSGAQFTDRERAFHEGINAAPVDRPENALTTLLTGDVLLTALQTRRALGLPKDALDFSRAIQEVRDSFLSFARAGRLQEWRMPSEQQIITLAARVNGKRPIFDNAGRLRGLE